MKKIIFAILILMTSCSVSPSGESKSVQFGDYKIKTIDGCEYIEYDYGFVDNRVYSLTHKGNCKNHGK